MEEKRRQGEEEQRGILLFPSSPLLLCFEL